MEEYNVQNYTAKQKMENFWYHYKWHTIIALFLIFAILICSLQFCGRTEYDAYVMIATDYQVKKTTAGGNSAEAVEIVSALRRAVKDYDESGEINISLFDLFYLPASEISRYEKEHGVSLDLGMLDENNTALYDQMMFGDYYVMLISPEVYEKYSDFEGQTNVFENISEYADGTDAELYSDYAVKLSSLEFYELAGICNLPSDTLLCLRRYSEMSTLLSSKENKANYDRSKEIITNIINY